MNVLSKKILETRKSKGLSQEDLAELSKVNLRTIQRIENNENEPRGKTLTLVCNALEIQIENFQSQKIRKKLKNNELTIINAFFLLILNLILMSLIGYLTLDSESNLNSKIGALLLSFFIPIFITSKTQKLSGLQRMLKFGSGFILYLLISIIVIGIPQSFVSGLIPSLLLAIATLFYGNYILNNNKPCSNL